jgi:hypothetical protein
MNLATEFRNPYIFQFQVLETFYLEYLLIRSSFVVFIVLFICFHKKMGNPKEFRRNIDESYIL